jgi:hypothetical protein
MKIFIVTLLLPAVLLSFSCDIVDVIEGTEDEEQFESGFFIPTPSQRIDLYRSNKYVTVTFPESVTPDVAEQISAKYSLTPVQPYYHTPVKDWGNNSLIYALFLKLPGGAELEDYLSNYPRMEVRSFGDIPEVQFCIPTFAYEDTGTPQSRRYVFDIIEASSVYPLEELETVLKAYSLNLLLSEFRGDTYYYMFRLTHKSPFYTLDMVQALYETELFRWVWPDGLFYMSW